MLLDVKYLQIIEDKVLVNINDKRAYAPVRFMKQLLQNFIDSYFVVISIIDAIMEAGSNFELNAVIKHAQLAIQEMYYQGALPYLNSCLRETLINAFTRFS